MEIMIPEALKRKKYPSEGRNMFLIVFGVIVMMVCVCLFLVELVQIWSECESVCSRHGYDEILECGYSDVVCLDENNCAKQIEIKKFREE